MFPERDTPEQKRKTLRNFGLVVGAIFALIGVWQLYRGQHETVRLVLWAIGCPLIVLGAIAPKLLAPIYAGWMKFAFVLGWVNSRILLSLIYFLMMTPVGVIMRIFGRDGLERRLDKSADSYWVAREPIPSVKEHCERQY